MDWPEPPPGKKLWDPPGGIEVYVHSGLSEACGTDETVGMDKVLSKDNIRRARACRKIGDQIEQGIIDEKEGHRRIGELLVSRDHFSPQKKSSLHEESAWQPWSRSQNAEMIW